jgi:hypothetical protein
MTLKNEKFQPFVPIGSFELQSFSCNIYNALIQIVFADGQIKQLYTLEK